jgi:hypothetical protein
MVLTVGTSLVNGIYGSFLGHVLISLISLSVVSWYYNANYINK